MLESLHIENIAVIEKTYVEFSDGFTVLTGETGAGKSIIIDSINAILGERTSKELIRNGCDKASVTALFSKISNEVINKLNDFGIDAENDELIIKRTITDSKSSCKINGQNAPTFALKEIAPYLIDIHGQHDSQLLLNPGMHRIYIDLLADNKQLMDDYSEIFSKMLKTRKMVKEYEQTCAITDRKKGVLNYQINELEGANIQLGEINELKQRKEKILNYKKIFDSLYTAKNCIYGIEDEIPGGYELIEKSAKEMMKISNFSENYSKTADKLDEIYYALEDIKENIDEFISDIEIDENQLEAIEARLNTYSSFKAKYGETEEEMLSFLKKAKEELALLKNQEELAFEERMLYPEQVEQVKAIGQKLTQSRIEAAKRFEEQVKQQLDFLDMNNVVISVDIKKSKYSASGADKIEFLISTNPGEPLKPLSKIASGGEMSRIMLSIKNVLANADIVPTLIFDEIDTGISGNAAAKVANRLKAVSNGKQVICVTHLAQIASKADSHLKITKNIVDDRAVTTVTALDFDGRKNELARIIGSNITEASLATAEEMLKN